MTGGNPPAWHDGYAAMAARLAPAINDFASGLDGPGTAESRLVIRGSGLAGEIALRFLLAGPITVTVRGTVASAYAGAVAALHDAFETVYAHGPGLSLVDDEAGQ